MEFLDIPRGVAPKGPERLTKMSDVDLIDEEASLRRAAVSSSWDDAEQVRRLSQTEDELIRRGFAPPQVFN